jgi:hypothetical protein
VVRVGGALRDLRFVGVSCIVNRFGVAAAQFEFLLQGYDYLEGGSVEMYPDDELYGTCVMTNPFVASLDGMARVLGRRIKRFVFNVFNDFGGVILHPELADEEPVYHLIMEMTSLGMPGQVGR